MCRQLAHLFNQLHNNEIPKRMLRKGGTMLHQPASQLLPDALLLLVVVVVLLLLVVVVVVLLPLLLVLSHCGCF